MKQSGLTLIEVLLILAVIGVLSAALLAAVNPISQLQKANDARRKSDLIQIQRALEVYYNDNGFYPPSCTDYYYIDCGGANVTFGNTWQPYLSRIPNDPQGSYDGSYDNGRHYQYVQLDNGQGYCLYANLERGGKDPQACPPNSGHGNRCPQIGTASIPFNGINPHCGQNSSHNCNYGVCSSNETP